MSDTNPMDLVIEDALNDSLDTSTVETSTDSPADTSVESTETATPEADSLFSSPDPPAEVDPLADAPQDEFEKKWGIPAKSVTGRENRLPHSRVKTMVTKA